MVTALTIVLVLSAVASIYAMYIHTGPDIHSPVVQTHQ